MAIAAARAEGCTCRVEATARTLRSVTVFELRHDSWCALLRAHEGTGSPAMQGVLYLPDDVA
jgi:hypothetical protein